MSSTFWKPALYKGSSATLIELPRPIITCNQQQGWKFDTAEVPLNVGIWTYGNKREGATISCSGQIAKDSSNEYLTELEMYDRYTAILSQLDMADETDSFEFFFYYDSVSATYRKLRDVIPVSFGLEYGDSDHIVFKYTLKCIARWPATYTTAPGLT